MDQARLISFTQDLVRLPSTSGQEGPVARRVEAEMHALGFDRVYVDANGSVVGIIQGSQPGPTLLYDAHTDTVGISPGVPWQHDPFGAEVKDGVIYGRGSADMKGALSAMIYAAATLDRSALHGRVVVSASTMEEVLEGVALKTVMDETDPQFVVIGEATDLQLSRGGRGRAEIHLKTIGRPAHSSAPHLGHNAVLDMMQVIAAVEAIELPTDPDVGPAILALTDIISDPYPGNSVIPSVCKATYDRRLIPGETAATVLAKITDQPGLQNIRLEAVIGLVEYTTYSGATLRCEKFFPAWLYPETEPFIQRALAGLHGAGIQSRTSAYRFCTNAAYSAGIVGVPTLGFGPATEADAHVVDEHLRIDDLLAAARGYQAIALALLQSESG